MKFHYLYNETKCSQTNCMVALSQAIAGCNLSTKVRYMAYHNFSQVGILDVTKVQKYYRNEKISFMNVFLYSWTLHQVRVRVRVFVVIRQGNQISNRAQNCSNIVLQLNASAILRHSRHK